MTDWLPKWSDANAQIKPREESGQGIYIAQTTLNKGHLANMLLKGWTDFDWVHCYKAGKLSAT